MKEDDFFKSENPGEIPSKPCFNWYWTSTLGRCHFALLFALIAIGSLIIGPFGWKGTMRRDDEEEQLGVMMWLNGRERPI